jgi:enediyne biosynthesis protein E4
LRRRDLLRLIGAAAVSRSSRSSGAEPYPVSFVDIAHAAGLRHDIVYGGVEKANYIVESNGCGVAFYDYDNDGWLDIFLLNGSRIEGFEKGREPINRLYKNNRDGTFTDVTKNAGLAHSGWASAVCIGDYDNDGFDDLFITYWGKNVLYHNNGDGTFTDVTEKAGVGGDPRRWNAGCTFVDYDRDGKLDLFVSNYIDVNLKELPLPGTGANCTWKGISVFCGPRGLKGTQNILYRNNGDGTFTDVSKVSGITNPSGHYGMTASVIDYNDDGWPDIFVVCDSTPSILYRNNKNGTFTDEAVERGVAYSDDGREQAGMGVAIVDYNGDGSLDIVKTLFADDIPALYQNDGRGYYTDVSMAAGLNVVSRYVQWGTGLVDFDNDSWPDLFYVTGHLYPELMNHPDYPYKGPRILYRNDGHGKFTLIADQCGPGLTAAHSSRGCAFGDFDNDGDMDVLIMNMNEPPSLLRTDVRSKNNWLKIKLAGTESNRTAIGSRVRVKAGDRLQAQQVESQSSYYSVNDLRLHYGLGKAAKADFIEVRWPNGKTEVVRDIPANQLVFLKEGSGVVKSVKFG